MWIDFAWERNMMIDFVEDVARCVLGASNSSTIGLTKRRGAGQIRHLLVWWCFGHKDVISDQIRPWTHRKTQNSRHRNESSQIDSTTQTFQRVKDGMARSTYSTDVTCSVSYDTRIHELLWWDDLDMSWNETMDAKWGISYSLALMGRGSHAPPVILCRELVVSKWHGGLLHVQTLLMYIHFLSTLAQFIHSRTNMFDFQPFSSLRKNCKYKCVSW